MMPVRRNQNWLPDIFSDFFDNNWMERVNQTLPAVNVLENEKEYRVELAAPGLTKDDFNVHVDDDNNLVIEVEKRREDKEEDKKGRFLRREFSYSKFCRTLTLPDDVNKDAISAKAENGVLGIVIPKVEHQAAPQRRSIEVK